MRVRQTHAPSFLLIEIVQSSSRIELAKLKLTIVIFAIALMGGCGMMYGYKPIKQFDKNEYEAVISSVSDENYKIYPLISDSAQFASYRMILSDSLWQQSTSGQPIQILYFKGDKLVSYHINCTAKGNYPAVNINANILRILRF